MHITVADHLTVSPDSVLTAHNMSIVHTEDLRTSSTCSGQPTMAEQLTASYPARQGLDNTQMEMASLVQEGTMPVQSRQLQQNQNTDPPVNRTLRKHLKPKPAKESAFDEWQSETNQQNFPEKLFKDKNDFIRDEDMHELEAVWAASKGYMSVGDLEADPLLLTVESVKLSRGFMSATEFFRKIPLIAPELCKERIQLLETGLQAIQRLSDPAYTAEQEYQQLDAERLHRMECMAPDPKKFSGGSMNASAEVWQEFLSRTESHSRQASAVLGWMRNGLQLTFVGTQHASQEKAPHRKRNMEVVRKMLTRAVGPARVDECLAGKAPAEVQFANHASVQKYEDFVTTELQAALAKGVVKEWTLEQSPVVVNGLKVVDDKLPKLRLCINPMYINLFLPYETVRCERLQDIVEIVAPGDYMTTSDDKSNYWQMAMHPDAWPYLAFRLETVLLVCSTLWSDGYTIQVYDGQASHLQASPSDGG